MAGAGFKDFTVGEVLTSADVDTYLMQQSVMRFADSAARGSALGTAVGAGTALAEGMMAYLDDIDEVQFFDGSAWARVGLPIGTAVPSSGQVLVFDGGSSTWVPRSGSVLQVVEATTSSLVTITSTGFTDTGLSATITPLYSSSKILAIASMAAELDAGTASSFDCEAAITRDSTQVREFRVAMGIDATLMSTFTSSVLDSPATTSAVTYKGQARLVSSGSSRSWRAQDNQSTSAIVLMEIAA
jgi:hypothetical protein